MTTMLITPTIAPARFALDVTKVAVIADFEGPRNRYYVRNFALVAKIAVA